MPGSKISTFEPKFGGACELLLEEELDFEEDEELELELELDVLPLMTGCV